MTLVGGLAVLGVGVGVTAAVLHRLDHGAWRLPDRGDVIRIVRGRAPSVPRTIYLAREAQQLWPGVDDAPAGRSSVVAGGSAGSGGGPVRTTAWSSKRMTTSDASSAITR